MQVLHVRATLRSTMHMVVAILCHMSEEVASNLEMFNALRALNTKKLVKDDPKVLDHIRHVQPK